MKRTLDLDGSKSPPAKKECQEDSKKIPIVASLDAPVSPPRRRPRPDRNASSLEENIPKASKQQPSPDLAAIEAGQVQVTDHLGIFSSSLSRYIRPSPAVARLQIPDWTDLYRQNEHPGGRHFVIHQHDHPISGPHYDLRLQFSETSSVSWSVMYGPPGDPNSRRLNRNATETRVHSLWNHIVETASPKTGSMIIWDTGEYEILPYHIESSMPETETDDSRSMSSESNYPVQEHRSESEKLIEAFHTRKIRLRLHGTRLPPNYTIILRMDKSAQHSGPSITPRKKRRRTRPSINKVQNQSTQARDTTSESPSTSPPPEHTPAEKQDQADSDNNDFDKTDYEIRINNAYPGSTNSIGSVHQRRWFITLDRPNSGFIDEAGSRTGKKRWVRQQDPHTGKLMGFEPFYVRGPEVERSVVTGRLGRDVLQDEKVEGFVPRRGWRAVLE